MHSIVSLCYLKEIGLSILLFFEKLHYILILTQKLQSIHIPKYTSSISISLSNPKSQKIFFQCPFDILKRIKLKLN